MRCRDRKRERGAALVSVLAIIAVAATIATGLVQQRAVEVVRTESIKSARQADSLLHGLENHLLRALAARRGMTQLYGDDSCQSPRVPIAVESMAVQVQLNNLHCRFNINSIGGSAQADDFFVNLVDSLTLQGRIDGIDGRVLRASIAGWTDPTTIAPYPTATGGIQYNASQPFRSVSELALLPEVSVSEWQQLAGYLTAVPTGKHGVDTTIAPTVLGNAARDTNAGSHAGAPRFVQAELSVLIDERTFYSCVVMDLERSSFSLREQAPCLR